MAKAARIEYPPETEDPEIWLANVLRTRFEDVLHFREAALDGGRIEGVHDMRVAIRRLRSVLRDFAAMVEKKPLENLTKSLKKLAGMLGEVRDVDVLLEELEELRKKNDPPLSEGIARIMSTYAERRRDAHAALVGFMTEDFIADLSVKFSASIDSSVLQPELFASHSIRSEGSRTIAKCFDKFFNLSDAFYDPFAVKRLHRLRIAGKHLRYAIELFAPTFGKDIKPFAEGMKEMQSHLGEVHDCDVWLGEIQTHAARKRRPSAADCAKRQAVLWLTSEFIRRRTKAYRAGVELWSRWEREDFGKSLIVAAGPT